MSRNAGLITLHIYLQVLGPNPAGVKQAGINDMGPRERINLVRFSDEAELLLPEPSGDRAQLTGAIEGKFEADGGTAFFDAVQMAAEHLGAHPGRSHVVAFTDGQDTDYENPRSTCLHLDLGRITKQP